MRMRKLIDKARGKAKMSERSEQEPQTASSATISSESQVLPFINKPGIIDGLKEELPQYLAIASDVSNEIEPVDWWKRHEADLPKWSRAARQILLVQPSSAAAERVFSILNSSFGGCLTNSSMPWKTTLRPLYSYNTIVVE